MVSSSGASGRRLGARPLSCAAVGTAVFLSSSTCSAAVRCARTEVVERGEEPQAGGATTAPSCCSAAVCPSLSLCRRRESAARPPRRVLVLEAVRLFEHPTRQWMAPNARASRSVSYEVRSTEGEPRPRAGSRAGIIMPPPPPLSRGPFVAHHQLPRLGAVEEHLHPPRLTLPVRERRNGATTRNGPRSRSIVQRWWSIAMACAVLPSPSHQRGPLGTMRRAAS